MIKYFLIAAFLQIVWSFTPSASNIVIQYIPVELYITLRWTISGLIFLGISLAKNKSLLSNSSLFWKASLLGVLGYGLASFGTLYGLKIGGVVNFALIGSISPIITAMISVIVLKERFNRFYLLSAFICVLGLFILVIGKYQISSSRIALFSTALIFGAYLMEALPFVYSKKLKQKIPLYEYLCIAQLSAAIFMWIGQLFIFQQFDQVYSAPAIAWACLVFVSIVACVLCYFVLYWLLNFIEGHKLALFDGLHTVFAALFGYLIFGEKVNVMMLLGGGLLLLGLYMANSKKAVVNEK